MKITNVQIINFLNAIPDLRTLEMPIKMAYAIKKNHRIMVEHYHDYETIFNEIKEKYPKQDDPERIKQVNELLMIENEVEIFTIGVDILDSDFTITLSLLDVIEFMIEKEG